ncbi:recombinase family protein [Caproiciproducens faecalis]|uniref:Recombinase family protein n=1 Tax=Caproiciproducens faecalis TaxID=2820301 RepID=A0ABS7DM15_9FIRM|nr:recombinase family protein [Caproiciproducens faecalis]
MIAIYARQSVDREDSISTDSQIEACRYEAKGEACREYVDKGYSGKNTDRPRFKELAADIENGEISKVIVYRLDRISRSILDFSNMMLLFARYRVEFVSSTEKFDTSTPMGRAMLNICMVFAQLERETIQQRVTDAYYSRSEKGFYMGGRVPYGFRLTDTFLNGKRTKAYILCEEEADQIRLMYGLYADPQTSYGDILAYLKEHGLSCRGKPWSRARVADHLKNPIYVQADLDVYEFFQQQGTVIESPQEDFAGTNGCYYYKGRKATGRKQADLKDNRLVLAPHEGIIPSDLWLKCRRKCLRNKQIQPARKAVNTWLAGLVKCGNCHYALTFKKYRTRRSRYLLCSRKINAKACKGAGTIYADEFEALIFRELLRKLEDFPVLLGGKAAPESPKSAELRIERNRIHQEIDALIQKVPLANETLMLFINRRMEELTAKEAILEQELTDCALSRENDACPNRIDGYLSRWDSLSLDDRRTVACSLIEVIYATDEQVEIYWKL